MNDLIFPEQCVAVEKISICSDRTILTILLLQASLLEAAEK